MAVNWMTRRLSAKLHRWVAVSSVTSNFEHRVERGPWWVIYLLDATEQEHEDIGRDLQQAPPALVEQLIQADFGLCPPAPFLVPVIHVPSRIGLDEVFRVVGEPEGPALGDNEWLGGIYRPSSRIAYITGAPRSQQFREILIHELCHAYCHEVLGSSVTIPWAEEGYTFLLVGRLMGMLGKPTSLGLINAFGVVLNLLETDALRSSEELMQQDPSAFTPTGTFLSHSAMLMYWLACESRTNEKLLEVCKKAVSGNPADPKTAIRAVEQAMTLTMPRIHERFVDFCKGLGRERPPQPRILSPQTFAQGAPPHGVQSGIKGQTAICHE